MADELVEFAFAEDAVAVAFECELRILLHADLVEHAGVGVGGAGGIHGNRRLGLRVDRVGFWDGEFGIDAGLLVVVGHGRVGRSGSALSGGSRSTVLLVWEVIWRLRHLVVLRLIVLLLLLLLKLLLLLLWLRMLRLAAINISLTQRSLLCKSLRALRLLLML